MTINQQAMHKESHTEHGPLITYYRVAIGRLWKTRVETSFKGKRTERDIVKTC